MMHIFYKFSLSKSFLNTLTVSPAEEEDLITTAIWTVLRMTTSDGEASVRELYYMLSLYSSTFLPGYLGILFLVRVSSMGQTDPFNFYSYSLGLDSLTSRQI